MTDKLTNKKAAFGILISFGLLIILTFIMEPKLQASRQTEQLAAVAASIDTQSKVPAKIKNIDLIAKSAIVYDVQSARVLYQKNADVPMPLASITKLVTALVADKKVKPTTVLRVDPTALQTEGDSGLIAGDTWRERDLSDFMLTMSSNDAASVFANSVMSKREFINTMNALVKQMGLSSMVLFNESGLDIDKKTPGARGSARDIAMLLAYISVVDPSLLEATTKEAFNSVSDTGRAYKVVNTNKIVNDIPGLIGGKTGYTDLAGGNLAVVFDAGVGHYIVVVVLGSTQDGRFGDVLKLVNAVL